MITRFNKGDCNNTKLRTPRLRNNGGQNPSLMETMETMMLCRRRTDVGGLAYLQIGWQGRRTVKIGWGRELLQ